MKILFINPPIRHLVKAETPTFVTKEAGFSPPLGLLQLATCINQNTSHEAKVLDTPVLNMNFRDIEKEIKKRNPDIIGMTAITFTLLDTLFIAKMVKEINSDIKVILGGPHSTLFPYETIKQKDVNIVVVGEGEITFQELMNKLKEGRDLKKIEGILFKNKEGVITQTKPRKFIEDINLLPFPDRTLTPYKKYFSVLSRKRPLTTAVTSKGCPCDCIFCDRPQAGGKTWRARSVNLVVDEMEACFDLGIKEILFYDDTWTMDMHRAKEICKEILQRNLNISWDVRTRADKISYDLVKLMKKAGCERINLGVESGTEKGLITIKKGLTLADIEKAFKSCKKVGIDSLAYFMFGLPKETREEMLQTINFAKKIGPDFCHFTVFIPFPETFIWRDLVSKKNKSFVDKWRLYAENPTTEFDPPTCNEYMNKKQLFEMCNYAYKSFYLRSNYILKGLIKIRSVEELVRKAKAGIRVLTYA